MSTFSRQSVWPDHVISIFTQVWVFIDISGHHHIKCISLQEWFSNYTSTDLIKKRYEEVAWSQLDHGVDALGFWGRRRQDQLPEQEGDDLLVGLLQKSIQKENVMYTSGLLIMSFIRGWLEFGTTCFSLFICHVFHQILCSFFLLILMLHIQGWQRSGTTSYRSSANCRLRLHTQASGPSF